MNDSARPEGAASTGSDIADRLRIHRLSTVVAGKVPPLRHRLLVPNELTVINGDGGLGKGVIAADIAAEYTKDGEAVVIADHEGHEREWRRRVDWRGGNPDLVYIQQPYKDGVLSLVDPSITDDYRAACDELNIGLLIIDSIITATAGLDVFGPNGAQALSRAVQRIGRTTLGLTHIAKGGGGSYGSVFFKNLSRLQWEADLVPGSTSISDKGITLEPTKQNEYPGLPTYVVRADGSPEENRLDLDWTPVDAKPQAEKTKAHHVLNFVPVGQSNEATAKDIWDTARSAGLDIEYENARRAIRRAADDGRIRDNGLAHSARRFWRDKE